MSYMEGFSGKDPCAAFDEREPRTVYSVWQDKYEEFENIQDAVTAAIELFCDNILDAVSYDGFIKEQDLDAEDLAVYIKDVEGYDYSEKFYIELDEGNKKYIGYYKEFTLPDYNTSTLEEYAKSNKEDAKHIAAVQKAIDALNKKEGLL